MPAARDPSAKRIGRYEIVRRLARGGMADLVVVTDGARELAVKQIRPDLAADRAYVAMFTDEARLVAMLDHPNVVRVLEVGAHGGLPFLAMELLDGAPVASLQGRGPLSLAEVIHIGAGAAAGLQHAHERRDAGGAPLGIVHRDVKPANLFVTRDGVVKVLDFGVARATDRLARTSSGVVKGTTRYFAPEQCRARPVDARSDVFSLAAVLWELLTGRPLFARTNDLDTMLAITETDAPLASTVQPGVPGAIDAALARGLARDREARLASAGELRAALLAAAAQLGIALPSEALVRRVREAMRITTAAGGPGEPPPAYDAPAERSGPITRPLPPEPSPAVPDDARAERSGPITRRLPPESSAAISDDDTEVTAPPVPPASDAVITLPRALRATPGDDTVIEMPPAPESPVPPASDAVITLPRAPRSAPGDDTVIEMPPAPESPVPPASDAGVTLPRALRSVMVRRSRAKAAWIGGALLAIAAVIVGLGLRSGRTTAPRAGAAPPAARSADPAVAPSTMEAPATSPAPPPLAGAPMPLPDTARSPTPTPPAGDATAHSTTPAGDSTTPAGDSTTPAPTAGDSAAPSNTPAPSAGTPGTAPARKRPPTRRPRPDAPRQRAWDPSSPLPPPP